MEKFRAQVRVGSEPMITFSDPDRLKSWLVEYEQKRDVDLKKEAPDHEWLRSMRTRLGISQGKMGLMVGLSQTQISRIETAKDNCPDAIRQQVQELVDRHGEPEKVEAKVPLRQAAASAKIPPSPAKEQPAPFVDEPAPHVNVQKAELPARGGEMVAGYAVEVSRVASLQGPEFTHERRQLGITSVEAGRRLGTTADMIWKLESGRVQPKNPSAWKAWMELLFKPAPAQPQTVIPPQPARPQGTTKFF